MADEVSGKIDGLYQSVFRLKIESNFVEFDALLEKEGKTVKMVKNTEKVHDGLIKMKA